ncbi:MAG TPA: helix-turn-helix transcriptional regulator, partial [Armatimonadota bacterium]|nr:helix-turn-helix transcriptional regulator [Armatimonadota bacterium]
LRPSRAAMQRTALIWDMSILLGEQLERRPGWQQRMAHRVEALFSQWFSLLEWQMDHEYDEPSSMSVTHIIDQFLRDNLAQPLTLSDIAAQIGMSVPNLTRMYRQQTGETVMEHLHDLRMQHAAALLRKSDLPIAHIGVSVGLADPSYFCRRFRQYYRTTPQQFRDEP